MLALLAILASLTVMAVPAQAQEDAFTVTGVPIDATAENAAVAREQAIAAGTPRALQRLMQRLVLAEDVGRIPQISASQATQLAVGFEVDSELRSATRYRAQLTVSFEPNGVRRLLRNYGVPFLESPAAPTLVVPVYIVGGRATLFTANPWFDGWDEARYLATFAPIVLPSGFGAQAGQVNADAVAAGDPEILASMAAAYGVDRVLVAAARPQGQTLTVDLTLLRLAEEFDANAVADPESEVAGPQTVSLGSVSVSAGESQTPYVLAADRAHEALIEEWKERTVIRSQSRTEMRLTVLYDSIGEWHSLQNAINASPFVTDRRLDALSRDGALITLTYRGVREQLSADLQRRGVVLRMDPQMGDVALNASRAPSLGFAPAGAVAPASTPAGDALPRRGAPGAP
jgi:hypothetical protein